LEPAALIGRSASWQITPRYYFDPKYEFGLNVRALNDANYSYAGGGNGAVPLLSKFFNV